MHLLDCYSLNTGLKINRPFIYEKFFPLNIEKFISFDPSGIFPSRQYEYWQDCIDILFPILERENISILKVSQKADERKYEKIHDASGQMSPNQLAYTISKSMLHLGVDGFTNHLASHYDKKIVSLFSDSSPKNTGPFFSKEENLRLILPKNENDKFSYSIEEEDKTINKIKPEQIAKRVCELLGIDFDFEYETVFIGKDYTSRSLGFVPVGNAIDVAALTVDSVIVRMDLEFNEQTLVQQLHTGKCNIITRKPVSLNILKHFKNNITQFVYLLGDSDSAQYVEDVYKAGIECLLMSEEQGEELEKLKFKYLDFGKIHPRDNPDKKNLDFLKSQDLDNLYYRSSKFLIKEGEVFYGEAAINYAAPTSMVGGKDLLKIIDDKNFWKEIDNYIFFKKV
jgi:hypothetical protein